eukprot:Nitzschia sp. Nitz4//scaffold6_size259037//94773//95315//NITZ4_001065-RA/size259037-processed-gene-0.67-mRNA-1//-1//CDS//3329556866//5429//frame0
MVAMIPSSSPTTVSEQPEYPILISHKRPRPSKPDRSVQFAPLETNLVIEVPRRQDLSDEELQDLFITKEEQKRIHRDILLLIRDMRLDDRIPSRSPSTVEGYRGLESLANPNDNGRKHRLSRAIYAVIRRQREKRPMDEMWLSTVYGPYSRTARDLALKRAEADRVEAFTDAPQNAVLAR